MNRLRIYIFFLLFCATGNAFSQQTHFVFLQTENREPFYVSLDKQHYSSSSIGYLIIPKLANGQYHIRLGFPKASDGEEQDYIFQIKDNDQGFLIRSFDEKGWGLFNLQSMNVQYSGVASKQKADMAAADQTISSGTVDGITTTEDTKTTILTENIEKTPVLLRKAKTDSGFIYTYSVRNEKQDTVSVFIGTSGARNVKKETESVDLITNTSDNTDKEIEKVNSSTSTAIKEKDTAVLAPIRSVDEKTDAQNASEEAIILPNSNCKNTADDKDFFKLRKRMVTENNTDEMIRVAKKALKEKCYSTEYIRNLGVLFLTDEARYQFFDAAYPFISDAYKYDTLIDLLKDAYYRDRFKAMIRK